MFAVPTRKRSVVLRVAIVAACLSSAFSIAQNATEPAAQASVCTPATCAYLNPDLAPDVRAKDLVNRMTLEEKVSQTLDQGAGRTEASDMARLCAARRGAVRFGHYVSSSDRHGCNLGHRPYPTHRRRDRR